MKGMKRISLLLLSLAITLAMTLPVFCTETETLNSENESGTTTLTVQTVAISKPEFTVTIPTGIPIGSIERTATDEIKSTSFEIGVSDITYLNGKQIKVTVSVPNGFYLYNGAYTLPYAVYGPNSSTVPLENNGEFYTFSEDETVSGRIDVNKKNITAAGTYSGIMTFTVSVIESVS